MIHLARSFLAILILGGAWVWLCDIILRHNTIDGKRK
jgi:hypothetical protein